MQLPSLRVRLLLAATIAIASALAISALLIARIFSSHVESRVASELQTQLNHLVANIEPDGTGAVRLVAGPADPRFSEPYSGLYWQLDAGDRTLQRARSLWDFELSVPSGSVQPNAFERHRAVGPRGTTLLAVARTLSISPPPSVSNAAPLTFRLIVGIDHQEIDGAVAAFRSTLWQSLAIIGTALLAAFAIMLYIGLLPLGRLSRALNDVHGGRSAAVAGTFPAEVQTLVTDMNRLLEQKRNSLTRARERASDLAHGFKTPLAVLGAVSRDLERQGNPTAATEIFDQIATMEQHVRRELARARSAGPSALGQSGVAIRPVIQKLVTAMERINADRRLTWSVSGDPNIQFAGDEADLYEIIGNLCENAGKWAGSHVSVDIHASGSNVLIQVDDDGPGVPAGTELEALTRGTRLDERADGHGLGLDIVAKAAADYGGSITLARSPLGGLSAHLLLPRAAPLLTET